MAEPAWAKDLLRGVMTVFYQSMYRDILRILDPEKFNAKDSPLTGAIRAGQVVYVDGEFRGEFSAAVSKELLSLGARFDGRSLSYKLPAADIPGPLHQWIMQQNERIRLVTQALTDAIDTAPARIIALTETIELPALADNVIARFDAGLRETLGVVPEITPVLRDALKTEYTDNIRLSIQNFGASETRRLRELVEDSVMGGFRSKKLIPHIFARQRVSVDRAKFVAYQETNLFVSTLQQTKYTQAGITHYRWRTVGDGVTRPDHAELNGRVFSWTDPPVVDKETGRRRHPRGDYGCRCEAIPLVGYEP